MTKSYISYYYDHYLKTSHIFLHILKALHLSLFGFVPDLNLLITGINKCVHINVREVMEM